MTTRVAVTGASGFIGLSLCRHLLERGAEVHALSRTPPTERVLTWHPCDVSNETQVRAILGHVRPRSIFHLAGQVSGARGIELVQPMFQANLVGTLNVLTLARELGCERVICLGSLQEPDEQIRGAPCSPYAAAKFAAGAYARMFAELYSLPVSIARPFMVYGAGQLDLTKLVPYVVSQILRGERARLSSGRQTFDWVYVDDVAESLLALAARSDLNGSTVNIGSGVLTSVRDVALGLGRRLNAVEAVELGAIPDRTLEQTRQGDVEATARLIGWRPRVSIEEGLDRAVAWYRDWFAAGGQGRSA